MTFRERQALAKGIADIILLDDPKKIKLILEELIDMSICSGTDYEIELFKGLYDQPEAVAWLREQIKNDYGISMEKIEAAVSGTNRETGG